MNVPSLKELVVRNCQGAFDRHRIWSEAANSSTKSFATPTETAEQLTLFSTRCTNLTTLRIQDVSAAVPLLTSLPSLRVTRVEFHQELVYSVRQSGMFSKMILDAEMKLLLAAESLEVIDVRIHFASLARLAELKNLREVTVHVDSNIEEYNVAIIALREARPDLRVIVKCKELAKHPHHIHKDDEEAEMEDDENIWLEKPKEVKCEKCGLPTVTLEAHPSLLSVLSTSN